MSRGLWKAGLVSARALNDEGQRGEWDPGTEGIEASSEVRTANALSPKQESPWNELDLMAFSRQVLEHIQLAAPHTCVR